MKFAESVARSVALAILLPDLIGIPAKSRSESGKSSSASINGDERAMPENKKKRFKTNCLGQILSELILSINALHRGSSHPLLKPRKKDMKSFSLS